MIRHVVFVDPIDIHWHLVKHVIYVKQCKTCNTPQDTALGTNWDCYAAPRTSAPFVLDRRSSLQHGGHQTRDSRHNCHRFDSWGNSQIQTESHRHTDHRSTWWLSEECMSVSVLKCIEADWVFLVRFHGISMEFPWKPCEVSLTPQSNAHAPTITRPVEAQRLE
jgi:hypothetical protein